MSKNMTLLSQDEIDTLVGFINDKRSSVGVDVLTQDNIDKMVKILKCNSFLETADVDASEKLMESSVIAGAEFIMEMDSDTGYVELFAVKEDKVKITPRCFDTGMIVEDTSEWGKAISPLMFDNIASIFNLKYTKATYDNVCKRYAEIIYGDASRTNADVYLPTVGKVSNRMIQ